MKAKPKIILSYEDLPYGNNEMIKSLKILQDTIKYYEEILLELKIIVEKIKEKLENTTSKINRNYM